MILMASRAQAIYAYAETEALNPPAMNEMVAEHGVKNRRWSDESLAAFEKAWVEVLDEEARSDPLKKKVIDSLSAFRAQYRPWAKAQALKPTYLEQ